MRMAHYYGQLRIRQERIFLLDSRDSSEHICYFPDDRKCEIDGLPFYREVAGCLD